MSNDFHAISPIDGRYRSKLEHLSPYFSEYALMRSRCGVEAMYAMLLSDSGILYKMTDEEKSRTRDALVKFSNEDYARIKEIESELKHDVKSCEVFLREKLQLKDSNIIHFGLTSEDVNNLAYTMIFKDYLEKEQLPQLKKIISVLCDLAEKNKAVPFPSRTHGQKASPSTVGKEIAVFISRLVKQYEKLKNFKFSGKLNGATGNYSAMISAYPDVDWQAFAQKLMDKLGVELNTATTQIEDHDRWAEYFNITRQINNIIIDLDTDFWLYISRDIFVEEAKDGEVGSSTMPHKVNPINFENSEGNMMISNALLGMLSDKLTRSRMQRDLSDSTVTRNVGVSLAHSYLAIGETMRGLAKVRINETKCEQELMESPELLAEPIQTMLKTEGIDDPYSLLKKFTRGKKITKEGIANLVDNIEGISEELRNNIRKLETLSYVGIAEDICQQVIDTAKGVIK